MVTTGWPSSSSLSDTMWHGDKLAEDNKYTAQYTFNEPAAGEIYVAVQVKYSGPSGCRQSYNNDGSILAVGPRPTAAEIQAVRNAKNAGDAFLNEEATNGVTDPAKMAQDLMQFMQKQPGVSHVSQSGNRVWVSFSIGGNTSWAIANSGPGSTRGGRRSTLPTAAPTPLREPANGAELPSRAPHRRADLDAPLPRAK